MKRRCVFVVTLLASAFTFASGTQIVSDGQTFEMSSTPGTNPQSDFNVYASIIQCSGTCTIKVKNDTANGEVRPRILLAADTVLTLDLAEFGPGKCPGFANGFVPGENARVIVRGSDCIKFARGGHLVATDFSLVDLDDLSFVDADGNAMSGTVGLGKGVLVRRMPIGVATAIDADTRLYLAAPGAAAFLENASGEVEVSGFTLIDACAGALPAGKTVKVGRNGVFAPFGLDVSGALTSPATSINDWTCACDVELTDETAKLKLESNRCGTLTGCVSGIGSVVMEKFYSSAYIWTPYGYQVFMQPLSISGSLDLVSSDAHLRVPSGSQVGGFTAQETGDLIVGGACSLAINGASSGRIVIEDGGALTLSAGAGMVSVAGTESEGSFALTLADLAADGVVQVGANVRATVLPTVTDVSCVTAGDRAQVYFRGAVDLASLGLSDNGLKKVTVSGSGSEITKLTNGCEITLADCATSVKIAADEVSAPSIRVNGGSVTLRADDALDVSNILGRAAYWADASVAASWVQVLDPVTSDPLDYTVNYPSSGQKYPSVYEWKDVRGGTAGNYRFRKTNSILGSTLYTNPYAVTNGLNGLTYMSWDTRSAAGQLMPCRMFLYNSTDSAVYVQPKQIVMVFGSQAGGGEAIFGTDGSGVFKREGTTIAAPILPDTDAAAACKIWLDGERQQDSTACTYNGKWQIVTFDPNNNKIRGVGCVDSTTTGSSKGGQNIAEILFFDEELSEPERILVERYLAEKWGILESYRGGEPECKTVEARVYGGGSVTLNADARLDGVYSGVINLNGRTLTLPAKASPSVAEVSAVEGRLGWFDPSCAESVTTRTAPGAVLPLCDYLDDRVLGKADGAYTLYGYSNPRATTWREDGWLDFRKGSSGAATIPNGSVLRFNKRPNTGSPTPATMSVKTLIMAQDSSAGGGTPFLNAVAASPNYAASRISSNADKFTSDDYTKPIWAATSSATYRDNSSMYLDGIKLDGRTHGFNGRKEVFSTVFGTAFPIGCFGDYTQNTATNAAGEVVGEIIGEIFCFSGELSKTDRETVEAYLMHKWCGTTLPGYGDLSAATVSGAGNVIAPVRSAIPAFGSDFMGMLSIEDGVLAFTLDAAVSSVAAIDALIIPEAASLSLPAEVTVNVGCSGKVPKGVITLISAGALANPVNWNVVVDKRISGRCDVRMVATERGLGLKIDPKGLLLTVR